MIKIICKSAIELFVIEKVKNRRFELGISQAELAHLLGVSTGFIGQVETPNHASKYNLNHLNKLASILNCKLADFMPDESLDK